MVDKKNNKYLNFLRSIFVNLKLLYIFPMISLLINNSSFNVNDAKVSIVFVLIFVFFAYMLLDIRIQSVYWINENLTKIKILKKEDNGKIINFINKFIFLDKIFYCGELLIIFRLLMMLIGIFNI